MMLLLQYESIRIDVTRRTGRQNNTWRESIGCVSFQNDFDKVTAVNRE